MVTQVSKPKLDSFIKYCEDNPEQRFWQALRNWSMEDSVHNKYVLLSDTPVHEIRDGVDCLLVDTFYL